VELAEKYRLGKKICEIIQQHHGTSLVSYFYKRAKDMEEPELSQIEEKDFRYAGPKPQTKEAGIVMLADAVEAASRTLEDPTPKRIETHVQNIIEQISCYTEELYHAPDRYFPSKDRIPGKD
jgi:membrane-associated HD superfamily phosphohydrolase